jgi:hypothetical protein
LTTVSQGTFIISAAPKVMMATGIDGERENSFSAVW